MHMTKKIYSNEKMRRIDNKIVKRILLLSLVTFTLSLLFVSVGSIGLLY